jgi:hypothetical protein
MLSTLSLIEDARLKHCSFSEASLGDGAALRFLNQRIRTLLLRYRESIRSLCNVSIQTAAVVSGVLVGVDGAGLPYYVSTAGDGFALHLDGAGIPYFDPTDTPIALDPFGASGSTPGMPLPADAIALFSFAVTFRDGSSSKVDVVEEALRHMGPPGHNPAAFLSANRLVPIKPAQPGGQDIWTSVVSATTSYLPLPTVSTLTDTIALPTVFGEPIIAGLAELFAVQSKGCTTAEKRDFAAAARLAETSFDAMALDIVGDLQVSSVIYEG